MPIHLDSHEPEVDLTPGTRKSDIVKVLYENPDLGFKPSEIQNILDIPPGTATTTLSRLKSEDYIGRTEDSYYHALEHREDLKRYVASLEQLDRMFEEKDYEEHTDIGGSPADSFDEDELEGELDELETELEDE
jgi:DNA-binding MarR family transcriptional regulator